MLLVLQGQYHFELAMRPEIQSRMFVLLAIVGNGQSLQWDLMSKIKILQS